MLVQTPPSGGREARLRFVQGNFTVLAPGDYVLCAVTGAQIALSDLRYWSVDDQEAYVSAYAATQAHETRRVRT
jgi:hypothetical protein